MTDRRRRRWRWRPDDGEVAAERLLLLREAEEAQEEVRRKVKPVRWEVFWRVVIEGEPMSEAAAALGLSTRRPMPPPSMWRNCSGQKAGGAERRLGLDDSPVRRRIRDHDERLAQAWRSSS